MTSNYLFGFNGTWLGDGSGGSLTATNSDMDLAITAEKQGTPFNVMLDGSVPTKNIYYEVTVKELKGNIAIGFVKGGEFQPGWKTKGMFYNGNVTNGSAALIVNFGDHVKAGDKVGVLLLREGHGVAETIFYLNEKCLGQAFRLENLDFDDAFHPCIHVSGHADVLCCIPDQLPATTSRQSTHDARSYLGDWRLNKLFAGPELGEFKLPEGHEIILTFQGGPKQFQLSAKVGNTLNFKIDVEGKQENFDKIKVSGGAATRMLPPPEIRAVENLISESLPTLHKMIISDSLIMTGPTAEFSASRHSKTFEPLAKY